MEDDRHFRPWYRPPDQANRMPPPPTLFPLETPEPVDQPLTTRERFERFHEKNPHVFREIRKMALAMDERRPGKKFAMMMIYQVLRWEYWFTTEDDTGFKLNNNYTPYYARLLVEHEPQLADQIEMREVRS